MAEFWSNNDRGYRLRLWLEQTGQNIAGNTSQVRVRLALLNTTTTFSGYSCSAYVDINGQLLNWSGSPSVTSYNQTVWLLDHTITVGHNSDGTKSVGFKASFSGSGGWSPSTLNIGAGSFGLTTIPRTSSVEGGTWTIGSPVTISISRASSSFTHTLRYAFGRQSGTIASGVGTSASWTIPMGFCNEIPTATSGRGTIYCDTYSGSTKIGSSTVIFTATVPSSVVPTLSSLTLTDTNTTAASMATGNNFIQIVSNISVGFNDAAGAYGSSIIGYHAEIVNRSLSTTSNGGTLGIMNYNGSATIRATVTDSRGRVSAAKDVTINVIEYFKPTLSFVPSRAGSGNTTINVERTTKIAPIMVNNAQTNTMTLLFKTAPAGSTSFTTNSGGGGTWTTLPSLTESPASLSGTFETTSSYDILAILSDAFTSTEFVVRVGTEKVVMSYDKDGRVGIGKVASLTLPAGSIDVAGQIHSDGLHFYGGKQIQHHQITKNDGLAFFYGSGFDFNNALLSQQIACDSPANGPTVSTGLNQFYVEVIAENNNFLTQRAVQKNSGRIFVRTRHSELWSPWVEQAQANHSNLVNTGWVTVMAGVSSKRVGDVVYVNFHSVSLTANTYFSAGTLPVDHRPSKNSLMFEVAPWVRNGESVKLQLESDGSMFFLGDSISASRTASFQISFAI